MFSGGDYREVARWLQLFATSHAKRESPRVEAIVEEDDPGQTAYRVRVILGDRSSPVLEVDATDAARNRGSLVWCHRLAAQIRDRARSLLGPGGAGNRAAS
jgi:hypothetical protein